MSRKLLICFQRSKWPGESTWKAIPLKVGDVCFAIIGEIVGRKYLAVRDQMTACVIINSPLHESAAGETGSSRLGQY